MADDNQGQDTADQANPNPPAPSLTPQPDPEPDNAVEETQAVPTNEELDARLRYLEMKFRQLHL